jgi:hypothetical protein
MFNGKIHIRHTKPIEVFVPNAWHGMSCHHSITSAKSRQNSRLAVSPMRGKNRSRVE